MSQADRRLIRRASAVVAVQTGVAAAVVVAVVIALVYSISQQERRDAAVQKMEHKAASILAEARAGERSGADNVLREVSGLPGDEACQAEQAGDWADALPMGESESTVCGVPVLTYVAEDGGTRAIAAMSLAEQLAETDRLARLSIVAGLIGVLGAAGIGWIVGRRAVRPLALALSSQRRFVADVSHELRTPLAILHTRAQLLQRQPATDPQQRQELDQLVEDARVLTDIVNDLLLSAEMQHRPETGSPVDLDQVVADIKRSFSGTAERIGADLVVDADPDGRHVITGAPSALRRAIAALVDNALGHVRDGGTITIGLNGAPGTVRVQVIDDGDGLDPERAAELIQRFRRGTDEGGSGHRLGLGLALVEEVVQAHNGTMEIDGMRGTGATVTLTFPAAR